MSPLPIGPRGADRRSLHLVHEAQPKIAVLVVEDDPTIRAALIDLLEDEGYATLQASDGAEALDILRSVRTPLVVLLDWMLPFVDGLTLLQMAATDPVLSSRHAYIFTSAAFPAGLRQVAALPQHVRVDVLMRPCNIELLLTKIEQAAERLKRAHEDAPGA
jgi:two-component system, NtrC family, nitrogen regulation response regulator NtrX